MFYSICYIYCISNIIVSFHRTLATNSLREIFLEKGHDKLSRDTAVSNLRNSLINESINSDSDSSMYWNCFSHVTKEVLRNLILYDSKR